MRVPRSSNRRVRTTSASRFSRGALVPGPSSAHLRDRRGPSPIRFLFLDGLVDFPGDGRARATAGLAAFDHDENRITWMLIRRVGSKPGRVIDYPVALIH